MGSCSSPNDNRNEESSNKTKIKPPKPVKINKTSTLILTNEAIKAKCNIIRKTKEEIINGTGFFIKNYDSKNYLVTKYEFLNPDVINQDIEIEIYNQKKMKFDFNNPFIKYIPEPKGITIIEINNNDEIFTDIKPLECDLNYVNGYYIYKDKEVFSTELPLEKSHHLSGKVEKINNFEFEHNIPIDNILPGSPIILKNNDINLIRVIGIQKESNCIFIGEIFQEICNNFIIAEIDIKEQDINKYTRIINSYEEQKRNWNEKELKNEYMNEDEIKKVEIRINGALIPSDYFYQFKYKGKYSIKYSFKNDLPKTNNMFAECNTLTNINFTNFDAKNVTNMSRMFSGCDKLTNLNLNNFNTQNVIDMSCMFSRCTFLNFIELSNFKTDNVTDMSNMFNGCKYIQKLNLDHFNTENVTDMSYMFSGCNSLIEINISNFNTKNVKNMSWMFSQCYNLRNLNLLKFNTQNVTDMSFMFDGCKSLTNLNLSSFSTQKVTNMSWMFHGCNSLTILNLNNFNTKKVNDMSNMFDGCKSLIKLNISSFNTDTVNDMSSMFDGCDSLKKENIITQNEKILSQK